MSHTTTLRGLAIRDTSAIHSAVNALQAKGLKVSLKLNAEPRMYFANQWKNPGQSYGRNGVCDFVLALDGCPYDVGLDLKQDGTYAPVFDEWAGHVRRAIGAAASVKTASKEESAQAALGQFLQEYARHAAINSAVAQGYFVEDTTVDEQGNIHLTLGNC